MIGRSQDIYGNWTVLSPDGVFMFYTSDRKANWYLDSQLARLIKHKTIQLDFEPNGPGCLDQFRSTPSANECVVCGTHNELTLHHVVPTQYRRILCRHFPYYRRDYHDCLCVCVSCHTKYELKADTPSEKLAKRFKIPLVGVISAPFSVNDLLRHSRMASSVLQWGHKMPESRKNELVAQIQAFSDIHMLDLSVARKEDFEYRSHGDLVVEQIVTNNEEDEFVQMWRQHFLDSMKPKHLPLYWEVKRPVFKSRQQLDAYR